MTSSPPPPETPAEARPHTGWTALRPRAWNLLLLIPLITLITPVFNMAEPRLGGLPFFYWFQLVIIPVGIVCTVTVHLMTRGRDDEESAAGTVAAEETDR